MTAATQRKLPLAGSAVRVEEGPSAVRPGAPVEEVSLSNRESAVGEGNWADPFDTVRFPRISACAMPPGDLPCTQTACRYHLAHRMGSEHRLTPTRDCSLAVANEGPHTLDEVAAIFGLSKERVRQIEEQALEKLKTSETLRKHCDARTSPRSSALQLARSIAAARGEHLCTTFDDSLSGDLARLLVRRQLRREFPDTPAKFIDGIIAEALSP